MSMQENVCKARFGCQWAECCRRNSVTVTGSEYREFFAPFKPREVVFREVGEVVESGMGGLVYCQYDDDRIVVGFDVCPNLDTSLSECRPQKVKGRKPKNCRLWYCEKFG